jgi:hypothetical protein
VVAKEVVICHGDRKREDDKTPDIQLLLETRYRRPCLELGFLAQGAKENDVRAVLAFPAAIHLFGEPSP